MTDHRPIGATLDGIGVTADLRDGEFIDGAVVILRVLQTDGATRHATVWSAGLDWITRRGLIEIARDVDRQPPIPDEDDDE